MSKSNFGDIFKPIASRLKLLVFASLLLGIFIPTNIQAQNYDTISNWDNIIPDWHYSAGDSELVDNPQQGGINPSSNCLMVITSSDPYDLIYLDLASPVNFEVTPVYRLKILAPPTGGSILFKLENSDNSQWEEIELTPQPGQWQDLSFDFSGYTTENLTRMVVFFDFQGVSPDKVWYIDDVIAETTESPGLTSNLPIVIINTYGQEIPDEPKIDAYMGIIDNGPGMDNNQYDPFNNFDGYIGIERRGQSTQALYPKKSWGFETRDEEGENLNVSILGMPSENDWILYAPYGDKSMLRNVVSYAMSRSQDVYCTRTVFCEVILNGDYQGVYVMMEKIKKDDNRVNIAKLKPEDIEGDELTGGYIVKVDKTDDIQMGQDAWLSVSNPPYPNAMNIIFQYNYPKADEIVSQQKNYIQDYISSVESSLTQSTFQNPEIGYNRFLNTGSFVDQMLVAEISKEVDKYRYSTYFFKEKDSDGGKLFAGPAWDFNLGYSNVDYWPPGNETSGWVYPMVEPHTWSIIFWWKRLMEDPYFKNLTKTRWVQLRQDALSNDNLSFFIDSVVSHIDQAQGRNYTKWPTLGVYVWPNFNWQGNDYTDEVAYFENWFFNRLGWMDYNMEGSVLNPSAELSATANNTILDVQLVDDYFSRTILKEKYFILNNAPPGIEIDTVIYQNASAAEVHLSAPAISGEEISLTIEAKVLNTWNDITTNGIIIAGINDQDIHTDDLSIYSSRGTIFLKCKQPELLGDFVALYNLSGQIIQRSKIQQSTTNFIQTDVEPGIYLCRFSYNGQNQTRRILLVD